MTEEYAASRYEEACALLPLRLRTAALLLPLRRKAQVEEIRLRIGRQVYLSLPDGEEPLTGTTVTRSDLEQTLDKAAEYSRYAAAETIRHGYVTAAGAIGAAPLPPAHAEYGQPGRTRPAHPRSPHRRAAPFRTAPPGIPQRR